MSLWTFAICTDGTSWPEYHPKMIESIRRQKIPSYEIIFCTEKKDFKIKEPDVRVVYIDADPKKKWITKKKNELTLAAKYPLVCYLHDYLLLDDGWYDGFGKFGYDWDICLNKVIRPDGERLRDWMSLDHPFWGHKYIPYDVTNLTDNMYVNGSYWCAWRSYMMLHRLDETLCWGQSEDAAWSRTVRNSWKLKFNPHSVVKALRFRQ